MAGQAKRAVVPVLVLATLSGAFLAGQGAYARTDWGVAADAPVRPEILWGECLRSKPEWFGDAKPGIAPGSRLYYHPVVTREGSQATLSGWTFYGSWRGDRNQTNTFTCTASARGERVTWDRA